MIYLYVIGGICLVIFLTYFGLWEVAIDLILIICGGESNSSGGGSSGGSGFGGGSSGGGGSDGEF